VIDGASALDVGIALVLLLSIVVGLWRGLVFEVMALAGWVVAFIAARALAAEIAPWLPFGAPGSALPLAAGWLIVFVATLVVWSLLARLVKMVLHATPLSVVDRAGGALFGAVRAAVLLLALTTLVRISPAAQSEPWRESRGAAVLDTLLDALQPWLPGQAQRWIASGTGT
jgi:membrane protein required for colicin V production